MILNTIKEGKIVPSQVTVRLIQKEMELSYNHKFLIDGFPRTEENRVSFEQIVSFSFPFPFSPNGFFCVCVRTVNEFDYLPSKAVNYVFPKVVCLLG